MEEQALAVETRLYESRKEDFERDHNQEWVVIHGDDIVGFFPNLEKAADAAVQRYGKGPYLIKQVGDQELPIPLSVFTRPMYA